MRRAVLALGMAAALGSGVAFWKSRRNDAEAERRFPPLGEIMRIGGTPVHCLQMGRGPALVLIHGAGGNLRDFTLSLMPRLARTHRVIAFDRPGHGYTGALHDRGESPAEQADLLSRALAETGVKRAIIGGYSYGGAVALAWALNHPESAAGLLLMNAVSNPWVDPPSRLYDLAAGRLTGPVFTTSVSAFAPRGLVRDTLASIFDPNPVPDGYLDHIGAGLAMRRAQLLANGRQVRALLPHIQAQSARHPTLTLPVEILHGAQDRSVPAAVHADVLARQIPHARYHKIAGVGHSVHHHAQDQVIAAAARLSAAAP